jgi:hypothetical protein
MPGLIVMHLHARNVSVIGALICTRGPSQLDIPLTMNLVLPLGWIVAAEPDLLSRSCSLRIRIASSLTLPGVDRQIMREVKIDAVETILGKL